MVCEMHDVVKYYGDRLILQIKELKVYVNDKIGVVGLNGSGKTTLLNILAGRTMVDEGVVKVYGFIARIDQFADGGLPCDRIDSDLAGLFNLPVDYRDTLSGGEKTRYRIASAFSVESKLLLADEPTANLDAKGITILEENLQKYQGAMLIVAHDRELLDYLCNKILEVEGGKVKLYNGNYTSYSEQKRQERQNQAAEYMQFTQEKAKLMKALYAKQGQSRAVRKAPKRMGNSEARLHKMGDQRAKANIDKAAKTIASRIAKLEYKEKPQDQEKLQLDFVPQDDLHCRIIIEGQGLSKAYGDQVIFKDAAFKLAKGERTAVIGDNGSGKTTLLKLICENAPGIVKAQNLRIGYFSQQLDTLAENETVFANVMQDSIYPETMVRTLLARLLFKETAVYKQITLLSGGERVRTALAKIILQDYNMLILDEPTNYLDLFSLEAIEAVLAGYQGNLLFVSHDRWFINHVATSLLLIQDQQIIQFQGNLQQYHAWQKRQDQQDSRDMKLVLERRLAELLARLSMPTKNDDVQQLDQAYQAVLQQLKALNKQEI